MATIAIPIPREQVAELCKKYGISRLEIFGSALREDFDLERSDVDLLVEFLPQATPSYFELVDIEEDLSNLLGGRKVDLVMRNSISRWIRKRVFSEAQALYVAP